MGYPGTENFKGEAENHRTAKEGVGDRNSLREERKGKRMGEKPNGG